MDGGMNISTADDLRVCGMQWMIGWYISTDQEDVAVNRMQRMMVRRMKGASG